MIKQIVYTDNYALILSDKEIKEGDWVKWGDVILKTLHTDYPAYIKKIIAHLPLSDAPILEGVPLLPPLPQVSSLLQLLDLLGEVMSDNPPPIEEVKRKRDEAREQRPTHFETSIVIKDKVYDGYNYQSFTLSDEPSVLLGKYITK